MDQKSQFLIRYSQLVDCINNPSAKNLLECSAAIRKLLIDTPLVHKIRKEYSLQLEYEVGLSTEERDLEMRSLGIPVPETIFIGGFSPYERKSKINHDKFLQFKIAKYGSSHFSVYTLIQTCANKLGGVHNDEPKPFSEEAKIKEFGELLSQLGMQGAFQCLIIVSITIVSALSPIVKKIESDMSAASLRNCNVTVPENVSS